VLLLSAALQDFVFCKEVRLGSYSPNAATLPPAAIVAAKAMAVDPRAEPRYGERVPYVVSEQVWLPDALMRHEVMPLRVAAGRPASPVGHIAPG
jgi:DNA polymerase elongation subunit (family B)